MEKCYHQHGNMDKTKVAPFFFNYILTYVCNNHIMIPAGQMTFSTYSCACQIIIFPNYLELEKEEGKKIIFLSFLLLLQRRARGCKGEMNKYQLGWGDFTVTRDRYG